MSQSERTPSPPPEEDLPEELLDEQIVDLPTREALSLVDPGVFGLALPALARTPTPEPATVDTAEPTPEQVEA